MMRHRLFSLGLFLACLLGFVGMRSARAEFEIPYTDSTNAPANVEFRGIWMYNRGFIIGTSYTGFESYAVGVDTSNNDNKTNGIFYYYDGAKWVRQAKLM